MEEQHKKTDELTHTDTNPIDNVPIGKPSATAICATEAKPLSPTPMIAIGSPCLSLREGPEGLLRSWEHPVVGTVPHRPESAHSSSNPHSPRRLYSYSRNLRFFTGSPRKKASGGDNNQAAPQSSPGTEEVISENVVLDGANRRQQSGKASSQELLERLRRRRRREHSRWASVAFKTLDRDRNRVLNRAELGTDSFAKCIRDCLGKHLPDRINMASVVDFVLGRADTEGYHNLSYREFEQFTWQLKHMTSDVDFETEFVFALFDPDRDGTLDLTEFERLFNFQSGGGRKTSSKEYIALIMKELDEDNNGRISPAEYRKWSKANADKRKVKESSPKEMQLPVAPEVKRGAHKEWAAEAFARLDSAGAGHIARSDLVNAKCIATINECIPTGHSLGCEGLLPTADFLLKKVNHEKGYGVTLDEFDTLTWKLQHLRCDTRVAPQSPGERQSSKSPSKEDQQMLLQQLRRRRRRAHACWASAAFKNLEINKNGLLHRMELGQRAFLECIQECLDDRLPDVEDVGGLVDFVLSRHDQAGVKPQHMSIKEFEKFTWQLRNITSDVDFETEFLFTLFDPNRDGKIELAEFERLLNFQSRGRKSNLSKEYVALMMKELDEDKDGSISPAEYRKWRLLETAPDTEKPLSPKAALFSVAPEVSRAGHTIWASAAFAKLQPRLDANASRYITLDNRGSDTFWDFLRTIQRCVPDRNVNSENVMPLANVLLKKCGRDACMSYDEFILLTWKLKRLEADKAASGPFNSSSSKSNTHGAKRSFR